MYRGGPKYPLEQVERRGMNVPASDGIDKRDEMASLAEGGEENGIMCWEQAKQSSILHGKMP